MSHDSPTPPSKGWFVSPTKHVKDGRGLLKAVRRFLRYNEDIIKPADRTQIASQESTFAALLAEPGVSRERLESSAKDLTESCHKSVPETKHSVIRENIEVFFVAVVIAMGIRAYFAQPFRIPTGSMQPTLNGIIGYPDVTIAPNSPLARPYQPPNFVVKLWDKVWHGRSYVDLVATDDDTFVRGLPDGTQIPCDCQSALEEKTRFVFFSRTYLQTQSGKTYVIPGSLEKVKYLLSPEIANSATVKKGQLIARGYVETGDQVIVDKFSYHWRRPQHDEVFVFNTRGIAGINVSSNEGSQHYIKRLAGVPGDRVEIKDRQLWHNGEVAPGEGYQKVMSQKDGYNGYLGNHLFNLEEDQYLALGDNSMSSLDSRYWGHVPAKNIVGRAIFVYLPLGNHFGPIH